MKKLQFAAELAFAADHEGFAAGIASLAAHEGRFATVGTGRGQRAAAAGADGVAALDGFHAGGAMVPEGTAAPACGAVMAVPLDHLTALEAGLLVGRHSL